MSVTFLVCLSVCLWFSSSQFFWPSSFLSKSQTLIDPPPQHSAPSVPHHLQPCLLLLRSCCWSQWGRKKRKKEKKRQLRERTDRFFQVAFLRSVAFCFFEIYFIFYCSPDKAVSAVWLGHWLQPLLSISEAQPHPLHSVPYVFVPSNFP